MLTQLIQGKTFNKAAGFGFLEFLKDVTGIPNTKSLRSRGYYGIGIKPLGLPLQCYGMDNCVVAIFENNLQTLPIV